MKNKALRGVLSLVLASGMPLSGASWAAEESAQKGALDKITNAVQDVTVESVKQTATQTARDLKEKGVKLKDKGTDLVTAVAQEVVQSCSPWAQHVAFGAGAGVLGLAFSAKKVMLITTAASAVAVQLLPIEKHKFQWTAAGSLTAAGIWIYRSRFLRSSVLLSGMAVASAGVLASMGLVKYLDLNVFCADGEAEVHQGVLKQNFQNPDGSKMQLQCLYEETGGGIFEQGQPEFTLSGCSTLAL